MGVLTCSGCCCNKSETYMTPLCEMMGWNELGKDALHLWYNLSLLQNEIEKRSSYLGKFRRTEEAQHLLDLISMTKDEEDLFIPFAKAAMADVFDELQLYMPHHRQSYFWNETKNLLSVEKFPLVEASDFSHSIQSTATTIGGGYSFKANIDKTKFGIYSTIRITYTVGIRIAATNAEIIEQRTLDKTSVCEETNGVFRASVSLVPELSASGDETSAEYIKSIDDVKQILVSPYWLNPAVFRKGDLVELGDELYLANNDGNVNETDKLVKTNDYRNSIHYIIALPQCKNADIVFALDVAVFEALVARIIYKWLQYPYPEEAPRYLQEYEENIQKVRKRCASLVGAKIVNRIPRI